MDGSFNEKIDSVKSNNKSLSMQNVLDCVRDIIKTKDQRSAAMIKGCPRKLNLNADLKYQTNYDTG